MFVVHLFLFVPVTECPNYSTSVFFVTFRIQYRFRQNGFDIFNIYQNSRRGGWLFERRNGPHALRQERPLPLPPPP